jgi:hypothetical protein
MTGSHGGDRLFLARISAVLFVLGLLIPPVIVVIGQALIAHDPGQSAGAAAAIFFSVSEVLAVILGAVGWGHASGKIGLFGGVAAIGLYVSLVILRCRAVESAVVRAQLAHHALAQAGEPAMGPEIAIVRPSHTGDKPGDSRPDPQALEQALAEAASISSSDWGENLGTGRVSLDSLPLTAVFLLVGKKSPQEEEEFGFDGPCPVTAFLRSFDRLPSSDPERARISIVNPKHIRRLICLLNNGQREGILELRVDQRWHARILFSCEFAHGRWRVTEFKLPVRQVSVVLQPDGHWKVADPRGAVNRSLHGAFKWSAIVNMIESNTGKGEEEPKALQEAEKRMIRVPDTPSTAGPGAGKGK